jgi:hypothetical protein
MNYELWIAHTDRLALSALEYLEGGYYPQSAFETITVDKKIFVTTLTYFFISEYSKFCNGSTFTPLVPFWAKIKFLVCQSGISGTSRRIWA